VGSIIAVKAVSGAGLSFTGAAQAAITSRRKDNKINKIFNAKSNRFFT
jgi:hypothetical protein